MPHISRFTDFDIQLFKAGKHFRIYEKLGSHLMESEDKKGVYFAVWAPNARYVSVVGDFNKWEEHGHPLVPRWDGSGIWEGFLTEIRKGDNYKYCIISYNHQKCLKGDPYARRWETPPGTASIVWDTWYEWKDEQWLTERKTRNNIQQPMSVYEVHLGSWKKKKEEGNRSLSYIELADELVEYVKNLNFTHVEFMPVMEHPYVPSWGYQITGYYAPSGRYGTPQEYMYLVDKLHQANIGVILDWVPSHFPTDEHGLSYFDGTHLYEHADPRKGYHPDWKSLIFNLGRGEVKSFLISNALFWMDLYHTDGLRVDAVASMLYLDYSRKEGEWEPNHLGGRENLESVDFLKEFNEAVYANYPDAVTIAEESTTWPMVSRPTYDGGLGFGQKWMMGWMHDTLRYMGRPPMYRMWHQEEITFSIVYAFAENFMLPLSHDEVVHAKGSLIGRMPGDEWQAYANLRVMFAYMFTHPGTKLLFMGGEFAQFEEWSHDRGLDWHVAENPLKKGMTNLIKDLNTLYRTKPSLYKKQFVVEGFEWISFDDNVNSVIIYLRKGDEKDPVIMVVCNLKPNTIPEYEIGVPYKSTWMELLNSDATEYCGTGKYNNKEKVISKPIKKHNRDHAITISIAPLSTSVFECTQFELPLPKATATTKEKIKKVATIKKPTAK
ncbi:MAG: 1,4-alpha-glucan branching protein GlgB [Saprospiraceae bacterium]